MNYAGMKKSLFVKQKVKKETDISSQSFQDFCRENTAQLSRKYPFLGKSQVRAKLKQIWEKKHEKREWRDEDDFGSPPHFHMTCALGSRKKGKTVHRLFSPKKKELLEKAYVLVQEEEEEEEEEESFDDKKDCPQSCKIVKENEEIDFKVGTNKRNKRLKRPEPKPTASSNGGIASSTGPTAPHIRTTSSSTGTIASHSRTTSSSSGTSASHSRTTLSSSGTTPSHSRTTTSSTSTTASVTGKTSALTNDISDDSDSDEWRSCIMNYNQDESTSPEDTEVEDAPLNTSTQDDSKEHIAKEATAKHTKDKSLLRGTKLSPIIRKKDDASARKTNSIKGDEIQEARSTKKNAVEKPAPPSETGSFGTKRSSRETQEDQDNSVTNLDQLPAIQTENKPSAQNTNLKMFSPEKLKGRDTCIKKENLKMVKKVWTHNAVDEESDKHTGSGFLTDMFQKSFFNPKQQVSIHSASRHLFQTNDKEKKSLKEFFVDKDEDLFS